MLFTMTLSTLSVVQQIPKETNTEILSYVALQITAGKHKSVIFQTDSKAVKVRMNSLKARWCYL